MNAKKVGFWLAVFLIIFYILDGDRWSFLPQSMRNASYESRTFLIGLWPDWLKPKDRNREREEEIERLEGRRSNPPQAVARTVPDPLPLAPATPFSQG